MGDREISDDQELSDGVDSLSLDSDSKKEYDELSKETGSVVQDDEIEVLEAHNTEDAQPTATSENEPKHAIKTTLVDQEEEQVKSFYEDIDDFELADDQVKISNTQIIKGAIEGIIPYRMAKNKLTATVMSNKIMKRLEKNRS